jgi:hypothetical protein
VARSQHQGIGKPWQISLDARGLLGMERRFYGGRQKVRCLQVLLETASWPDVVRRCPTLSPETCARGTKRGLYEAYLEFKIRLPEQTLMRIDKLSSAWSTESRLPFIDSALVRFAMSIPPEIMIRNQPKYILKKAAEGLLPDPIIYRDKAILPGEALQMLRRFFGQVSYIILDSEIWEREIFNFDRIKTMLNMFKSGRRAVSGQIWSLFLLFLWYRYWIERKGI